MLIKNSTYEMMIDALGQEGEGIGRIDGFTIFVEGALPGDTIEVLIMKLKKSYGYGKLVNIIQPSEHRMAPACDAFTKCGGCSLQHLSYQKQLEYKTDKVANCIKRIAGINFDIQPTIGMDNPFRYRNKAQFPVGNSNNKPAIGFFAKHSHRIVQISDCKLQLAITSQITRIIENFILQFNLKPYDEENHTGLIRHVLIRSGFATNEIMVCIIINGKNLPHAAELIKDLQAVTGLTSIMLNFNRERTNVIMGSSTQCIYGKDVITDYIGDLRFEISALSFFQVNPVQTKILYDLVTEFAEFSKTDIVIDAYCGIGTISLFIANHVKKVYGIEIINAAIADANRNAALNNITNAEFICGESEKVIPNLLAEHISPDVIIVDPPRKGCDEKVLKSIIDCGVKKLVYVSCDAATLARDIAILKGGGFELGKVQPVDCFPMTWHVETIVLLQRQTI